MRPWQDPTDAARSRTRVRAFTARSSPVPAAAPRPADRAARVFVAGAVAFAGIVCDAMATSPAHPDAGSVPCPAVSSASLLDRDLPRLRARLVADEPIRIVTFGSSSTSGAGASGDRHSYPSHLAVELVRLYSGHTIEVINAGIPGEDIRSQVARLDRELAHRPDLVIWQVGTNALLRRVDMSLFLGELQRGIALVRKAGVDMILMDLQYAPRVVQEQAHFWMLAALENAARRNRVPLFRRFALMRDWADAMGPGYAAMLSEDGLHMNDRSYACLAERLAQAIFVVTSRSEASPPKATAGPARGLP